MKKLTLNIVIIFLLFAGVASAAVDSWYTTNQITVAWNAVTKDESGAALNASEISYVLYIANNLAHENMIQVIATATTQHTMTMTVEGDYYVGVKAVRTVDGKIVGESRIVWSDENPYNFGIRRFSRPAEPVWNTPNQR